MSLYALTSSAIKRLKGTVWGTQVPAEYATNPDGSISAIEGGQTTDTGVQAMVTQLVNGFSSTDPIALVGNGLQLVQPPNAPGVTIQQHPLSTNNTAIQIVDSQGNVVNLGFNGMSDANGISGSFTVLAGASISVNACVAQVLATNLSFTFQNGLLVSVK